MPPSSTSTSTITRKDTLAREVALKLLYVLDVGGAKVLDEQLDELLTRESDGQDVRAQGNALFRLVREHLPQLDECIQNVAINWQLSRMPAVDRTILRLGACELLHAHEVPPKVAISEAIELAKKYSTEKSGAFVNGVLDKLYQTLCPDKV